MIPLPNTNIETELIDKVLFKVIKIPPEENKPSRKYNIFDVQQNEYNYVNKSNYIFRIIDFNYENEREFIIDYIDHYGDRKIVGKLTANKIFPFKKDGIFFVLKNNTYNSYKIIDNEIIFINTLNIINNYYYFILDNFFVTINNNYFNIYDEELNLLKELFIENIENDITCLEIIGNNIFIFSGILHNQENDYIYDMESQTIKAHYKYDNNNDREFIFSNDRNYFAIFRRKQQRCKIYNSYSLDLIYDFNNIKSCQIVNNLAYFITDNINEYLIISLPFPKLPQLTNNPFINDIIIDKYKSSIMTISEIFNKFGIREHNTYYKSTDGIFVNFQGIPKYNIQYNQLINNLNEEINKKRNVFNNIINYFDNFRELTLEQCMEILDCLTISYNKDKLIRNNFNGYLWIELSKDIQIWKQFCKQCEIKTIGDILRSANICKLKKEEFINICKLVSHF